MKEKVALILGLGNGCCACLTEIPVPPRGHSSRYIHLLRRKALNEGLTVHVNVPYRWGRKVGSPTLYASKNGGRSRPVALFIDRSDDPDRDDQLVTTLEYLLQTVRADAKQCWMYDWPKEKRWNRIPANFDVRKYC